MPSRRGRNAKLGVRLGEGESRTQPQGRRAGGGQRGVSPHWTPRSPGRAALQAPSEAPFCFWDSHAAHKEENYLWTLKLCLDHLKTVFLSVYAFVFILRFLAPPG